MKPVDTAVRTYPVWTADLEKFESRKVCNALIHHRMHELVYANVNFPIQRSLNTTMEKAE